MKVFAILTRFLHHKPDGGYKRLLSEFEEIPDLQVTEFGNDETNELFPRTRIDKLQSRYKWLAEWRAWKYAMTEQPDLVHIMYGEEYFRFGHRLFTGTPLIATFHQPSDVLDRELRQGDHGGRIAGFAHRINKNRFQSLAAAIVTNPDQKVVLEQFMPEDKIHVIPLGVDVRASVATNDSARNGILTLGNWFRDWDLYLKVVERMPAQQFHLVNRQLPSEVADKVGSLPNCTYHKDIGDTALHELIHRCHSAFLPLKKLAGSNALLELLAGGLPIIMSNANAGVWRQYSPECVALFESNNVEQAVKLLEQKIGSTSFAHRAECIEIAKSFSWESAAERTYQLYQNLT